MKKKLEIALVAGARPNFMKIAPIVQAMKRYPRFRPFLIHTGQHYDRAMSESHWKELRLPRPDINLGVGSGSHGEQTALIMERLESVLLKRKPPLVIVVGDVNSTMAGALVASKLHIPIAHVEAGLRSQDRTMPEEINRIVTDSVSDYLFTHSTEGDRNLLREGIPRSKIFFVGNVMIDTLDRLLPVSLRLPPLSLHPYGLVTLHRPNNVDRMEVLQRILRALSQISSKLPLYFPVHPRTAKQLRAKRLLPKSERFFLIEPLSYLGFVSAMARASLVLTDSGGIQEETTALGIPCLTLRKTSERMVTVWEGTNRIVGDDPRRIVRSAHLALRKRTGRRRRPKFWDGRAAIRIMKILNRLLA